jgi:hypothetical protein
MSVTGGILAGVGLAGSIGAAAIGSNASQNAASTQANAADQAAQLQYQASQNALGFQEQEFNQSQANLQPWLQSGAGALSSLDYGLGITPQAIGQTNSVGNFTAPASSTAAAPTNIGSTVPRPSPLTTGPSGIQSPSGGPITAPGVGSTLPGAPVSTPVKLGSAGTAAGTAATPVTGTPASPVGTAGANPAAGGMGYGSLLASYPGGQFTAPTAAQAEQYPGEQFMMQQGNQAIQQSAAASGGLLTGGTAKALDQYSQGLASTDYQNVYNNTLGSYDTNYNAFENNQANSYNRLASLAGLGQTTAQQLGSQGQSAANAVGSNLLGTASAMGQDYQNAAAANASGYVGSANAWGGALSGSSGSLQNLLLLQQLGLGGNLGTSASNLDNFASSVGGVLG